jgi:hypothetical protein
MGDKKKQICKSANATFIEDYNYSKIQIIIDDKIVELSDGDYIEFNREGKKTIAKILTFGWHNSSQYANRIFFLPWREEEKRWGSNTIPMRGIPLEFMFFCDGNLSEQLFGDWTTIRRLEKSPDKT